MIPSVVIYNGEEYSVMSIGNRAFNECSGLTSITIGNGVTSIGEYNQEIKGVTNVEIIPVYHNEKKSAILHFFRYKA